MTNVFVHFLALVRDGVVSGRQTKRLEAALDAGGLRLLVLRLLGGLARPLGGFSLLLTLLVALCYQRLFFLFEGLALRFLLLNLLIVICTDFNLVEKRQSGALRLVSADAWKRGGDGWQTGVAHTTRTQVGQATVREGLLSRCATLRLLLGLSGGASFRLLRGLLLCGCLALSFFFNSGLTFGLLDRSGVSDLACVLLRLRELLRLFDRFADLLRLIVFLLFALLLAGFLLNGLADAVGALALILHLTHRLLIHLYVLVHHHLLEENEILNRQNLLQQALMNAFRSTLLRHDEVRLRDAKILNVRL